MPNPFQGAFEVVESKRFRQDVRSIMRGFRRWDEIKHTVDLDIARNPEAFEEIPGTGLHAVTLSTSPPRTLYFTVDNEAEKITLEALL